MSIAHTGLHAPGGAPLPTWLSDVVLLGVPVVLLVLALLVLESRTRPARAAGTHADEARR